MSDNRMPRFSHDLIAFLDEHIARPVFPITAAGFAKLNDEAVRQAAFTAGARSVVDWLVEWQRLEEQADAEDERGDEPVSDGPVLRFPRIYGADGEVREIEPPVRVAEITS